MPIAAGAAGAALYPPASAWRGRRGSILIEIDNPLKETKLTNIRNILSITGGSSIRVTLLALSQLACSSIVGPALKAMMGMI